MWRLLAQAYNCLFMSRVESENEKEKRTRELNMVEPRFEAWLIYLLTQAKKRVFATKRPTVMASVTLIA